MADKWGQRLLSPAFFFWLGGFLAAAHHFGWEFDPDQLNQVDAMTVVGWAAASVALVVSTDVLVEALQFPMLRLLEGYVPQRLASLRSSRIKRHRKRIEKFDAEWKLLAKRFETLEDNDRWRYSQLDRLRSAYPEDRKQIMPTMLGNLLRAAESYPPSRYGLATTLVWPRLWLAISDQERLQLGTAQQVLFERIGLVVFSAASLIWAIYMPAAGIVSIILLWFSYRSCLRAARDFGDLLRASFDLNHRVLVQRLGWTLADGQPMTKEIGGVVTLFLARGKRPASDH